MIISSIAAVAKNNAIGKNNQLIWRLPADMQYFKDKTTGHCVITGRKNYESIPVKFRPLEKRTNIVVTHQSNYSAPGAIVVHSITEAIETARKKLETEVFIIGGAEIYKQTINIADRIYLTEVHENFDGDAFFPIVEKTKWKEVSRVNMPIDDKHKHSFSFCILEKI
ncbi:MAG: dihydrofolate reductase [Bacteroidia bacterium]|nr:dihydrofolate reductase [Bacteroidia bacterium]